MRSTSLLLLACGLASSLASQCDDMDTQACILLEKSNPSLCQDPALSFTACPRHCNLCPLTCYFCEGPVEDFHNCNSTMLCDIKQQCMLRHLKSSADNHHEYVAGCANVDACDEGLTYSFGRRDVNTRNIEVSCCTSDLCNAPFPITTGVPITTSAAPTTTSTPQPTTSTPKPVCKRDILMLIEDADGLSGSLQPFQPGGTRYTYSIKDFLKELVNRLDIGHDANLIELATFDNDVNKKWDLGAHTTRDSLNDAISNLGFDHNSNNVDTDELVHFIERLAFASRAGDRPTVPNDILLLADNRIDVEDRISSIQQQHVTSNSGDIIVIDVGTRGNGASTLSGLATDSRHFFHVDTYTHLLRIIDDVVLLLCT